MECLKLGMSLDEFKYLKTFTDVFSWGSILKAWAEAKSVQVAVNRKNRFEEVLIATRGDNRDVKDFQRSLFQIIREAEFDHQKNDIDLVSLVHEMEGLLI